MNQLNFHNDSFKQAPPQRNFSTTNLPILQKAAEAYKLWHGQLPHIPKLARYSLGEKITVLFTDVIELILTAGFAGKEHKTPITQKANIKLDTLKFFLQLAWELRALDNKQFSDISAPLAEVGRMLGGWQRQLLKETPPLRGGVRRQ